jgi:hypothetical protein
LRASFNAFHESGCPSLRSARGFEDGKINNAGKMPIKYLHRIREVITESRLLAQYDIDDVLKVLPKER